jgi:hypothetical protein
MGVFGRAYWGAAAGRTTVAIILAALAVLGFSADYWVRGALSWFGANPADATITILRIIGAGIGVLCIVVIALPYILAAIRPRKFFPSFESKRDIDAGIPQFDLRTGQQLPNRVTFVHVHVEALRTNVTSCTGAITALEKLDSQGNVVARLDGTRQLIWAPREHRQFQQVIAPGLPQDLDLFRTVEGINRLEVLSVGHPQSWLDFFYQLGRYRITVAVHGGERTEVVRVIIDWRGQWNKFDAE